MKSRTKNILIGILIIAAIAAGFGYYLFNKGPINVRDSGGEAITASGLYQALSADPDAGLKKYAGKILEVTGDVKAVSLNQSKQQVVLLQTATEGAYVNCTMEENDATLKVSAMVTIKGICSGIGQGDEDLGIKGDVYLTRCILKKR